MNAKQLLLLEKIDKLCFEFNKELTYVDVPIFVCDYVADIETNLKLLKDEINNKRKDKK